MCLLSFVFLISALCVCTGPSGVSSDQQKLLDNLEDDDGHKFSSPVMKQCRGEDDTSTGMSSLFYHLNCNNNN